MQLDLVHMGTGTKTGCGSAHHSPQKGHTHKDTFLTIVQTL